MKSEEFLKANIAIIYGFTRLTVMQYDYFKNSIPNERQVLFSKYYQKVTTHDEIKRLLPKEKQSTFDTLKKNRSIRDTMRELGYEKYDQVPEDISEELTGYRLKDDYFEQLRKGKFGNFSDLMDTIISLMTQKETALLLPISTLFTHIIKRLEMHFMQFYTTLARGKTDAQKRLIGDNLPNKPIIFPTDINTEQVNYLRIPAQLARAFQISSSTKYYMGIGRDRTDALFFFPKASSSLPQGTSGSIQTVLPPQQIQIFDEITSSFDKEFIVDIRTHDISIWYEPVEVAFRGNGAYLKVPPPFLEMTPIETHYYESQGFIPEKPAFILSYDCLGNLVYHKILYTNKVLHNLSEVSAVLLDEVPSVVETLDDTKIMEQLSGTQRIYIEEDDEV